MQYGEVGFPTTGIFNNSTISLQRQIAMRWQGISERKPDLKEERALVESKIRR